MRLDATAYLAPVGFETQLRSELRGITEEHGRLLVAPGPRQAAHWAQNVWLAPERLSITSIGDAARQLRAIQRNWAHLPHAHHRRALLIAEKLPHVSARPLQFPAPAPRAPLGSWTLLDPSTVLASGACTSPFPNGEVHFLEPESGPPNRAYLKLWEALTTLGAHPSPGERCLDAGASPGGWTWALAQMGAHVVALDRAPLDPRVAELPGVEERRQSAFGLEPDAESFDWVFCDVVCYPERLWRWVEGWLERGNMHHMVCTVKFQGEDHYGPIADFSSVPGSRLVHLSHNKHELTWIWSRESARSPELSAPAGSTPPDSPSAPPAPRGSPA